MNAPVTEPQNKLISKMAVAVLKCPHSEEKAMFYYEGEVSKEGAREAIRNNAFLMRDTEDKKWFHVVIPMAWKTEGYYDSGFGEFFDDMKEDIEDEGDVVACARKVIDTRERGIEELQNQVEDVYIADEKEHVSSRPMKFRDETYDVFRSLAPNGLAWDVLSNAFNEACLGLEKPPPIHNV